VDRIFPRVRLSSVSSSAVHDTRNDPVEPTSGHYFSANGQLAARVCEAALSWGNESLVISPAASDLDIDAFAVDLGLGPLVVTAQVRKSKAECCMVYNIYSLRTPPELLRSVSGGQFFSAADTDLDGRVEIWTDDAAIPSAGVELDILVREAGGTFTNTEGRPGPHGRGAVATNGLLHEAVLTRLNGE
jgi:hypothetical protein